MQAHPRRVRYKFKVPLVGTEKFPTTKADVRREISKTNQLMNCFSVQKPERRIAAGWMDNFIQLRRNITLCLGCAEKYRGWRARFGYRFTRQALGDCTACGKQLQSLYHYVPEEQWASYWKR